MSGRPPATIRDVARSAGVSTATVSRVLNDSAPVAPATRERVRRAVAELQFVTSPNARSMRPGVRSMTWGLLVDDVDSHWFGQLTGRLDEAAGRHGSTLLTSITHKDPVRERELVAEMAARRVDGLLIVPTADHTGGLHPLASPVPVVYVDRAPSGSVGDLVTFDYFAAVRAQVEELWTRGHRRIAFVGGVIAEDPGTRRHAAYRDTLHEHGQVPDPDLVSTGHLVAASAGEALRTMLARPDPPTAVVTTVGALLFGVLETVQQLGARLEVVGSQDFGAGVLTPVPLTLVQADVAELARVAAELLCTRIRGQETGPAKTVLLPTTLVHHGPRPTTGGAPS